MKRIQFFSIALAVLILHTSCDKFLTEQSQDEIRPSTIQDLKALMAGSGYPYQTNLNPFLDLMTDDIQCNGGQGQKSYVDVVRKGKPPFTWSKDMYQELLLPSGWTTSTFINSWKILYEKITGCNTVIAHIDKVDGSEADRNNLQGQALTMRAYYYFLLVNMYGKPYNAPGVDPRTSPGVPLRLQMEVTDSLYERNSVAEVYAQIEADLKGGLKLMQDFPQNNGIYKMSPLAALAMLSRVYLYQEKWEECIAVSNTAISLRPALTQLSTFKARPSGGYYLYNNGTASENSNRIYDPVLSKEIIWAYKPIGAGTGSAAMDEISKSAMTPGYSNTMDPAYSVSDELMSLYETRPMGDTGIYLADLRSRTYIISTLYFVSFSPVITYGFKFLAGSNGVGSVGIRTAELYLNRAEANIQLSIKNGDAAKFPAALNDLNTLRSARYDARLPYANVTISDPQELLSFCRNERRKEFPFEGGHRWFDLRRYGMPSISHFYEEDAGTGETHKLEQGDNRYTLPIPNVVLERNVMLGQNP